MYWENITQLVSVDIIGKKNQVILECNSKFCTSHFRQIQEACRVFSERYSLQSLTPVFKEIFAAHNTTDDVLYSLSSEAQGYFDEVESKVKLGLSQPAADDSDDDDEEEEEEGDVIKPVIGLNYVDQLGRLCLSLHVFSSALEQTLARNPGINIGRVIPMKTVQNARALLDHILKQNKIIRSVSYFYSVSFIIITII